MSTLYFVLQLFSLGYVVTFGTVFLFTQLRCIIHDRSYTVGLFDYILGASVTVLVVLGLPVIG